MVRVGSSFLVSDRRSASFFSTSSGFIPSLCSAARRRNLNPVRHRGLRFVASCFLSSFPLLNRELILHYFLRPRRIPNGKEWVECGVFISFSSQLVVDAVFVSSQLNSATPFGLSDVSSKASPNITSTDSPSLFQCHGSASC